MQKKIVSQKSAYTILVLVLFLLCCGTDDKDRVFLVEETNYIHSSNKKGTCEFIDQAIERGYKIKEFKLSHAPYYNYKICEWCFTPKVQQDYNEKIVELQKKREEGIKRKEIRDSLVNSVSEEVRQAIIEDFKENTNFDYY